MHLTCTLDTAADDAVCISITYKKLQIRTINHTITVNCRKLAIDVLMFNLMMSLKNLCLCTMQNSIDFFFQYLPSLIWRSNINCNIVKYVSTACHLTCVSSNYWVLLRRSITRYISKNHNINRLSAAAEMTLNWDEVRSVVRRKCSVFLWELKWRHMRHNYYMILSLLLRLVCSHQRKKKIRQISIIIGRRSMMHDRLMSSCDLGREMYFRCRRGSYLLCNLFN